MVVGSPTSDPERNGDAERCLPPGPGGSDRDAAAGQFRPLGPGGPGRTLPASDAPLEVLGLGSDEFEAALRARGIPAAGAAPAAYRELFRTGRLDPERCGVSAASAASWRRACSAALPGLVEEAEETGDAGTTVKLVFALDDGRRIESVAIPMYGGSYTLCVSSQVGCARGCAFCETGGLGLVRNLRPAEIVGQALAASAALGLRFRNIVFMGMGEPLDNPESLAAALRVLMDRRGFAYSQERITICTSGDAAGIARFAALGLPRLNLSVSLNAASDELRSRLMPVNQSTPLEALASALRALPRRRNFAFGVNYCLIPGVNDDEAEARSVATFAAKLGRALVNLIPYNPGSRPLARPPTEAELARFEALLRESGAQVKRRAKKGSSIMAGCGQLGARLGPDDRNGSDRGIRA